MNLPFACIYCARTSNCHATCQNIPLYRGFSISISAWPNAVKKNLLSFFTLHRHIAISARLSTTLPTAALTLQMLRSCWYTVGDSSVLFSPSSMIDDQLVAGFYDYVTLQIFAHRKLQPFSNKFWIRPWMKTATTATATQNLSRTRNRQHQPTRIQRKPQNKTI